MVGKIEGSVDVSWFMRQADRGDWVSYDNKVTTICNENPWIVWTKIGINSGVLNERDLAISILQKTQSILDEKTTKDLFEKITRDENLHLRRKAAIALWKHGNRGDVISAQLIEALNDEELRDEVSGLLKEMGK